jgi:benzodiazapine receptor
MNKALRLGISLITAFIAGGIGSLATIPNIPAWYAALEKPFFSPPNWIFGPVWTLLYLLMGIALFLVWTAHTKEKKKPAYIAYGVQLVLNAGWSLVFFGLHAPWAGLVVILLLLIAIGVTGRRFWPISRAAAWLIVPYLLWVIFATALNLGIALLN